MKRRVSPIEVGKKTKILRCSCGSPEEFLVVDKVVEVKCVYCLFGHKWTDTAKYMRANQRFKFEKLDQFWCNRKHRQVKQIEKRLCRGCKWLKDCKEMAKNKGDLDGD